MLLVKGICSTEVPCTVADPDLQIRGGGGADHPDPEIRAEGVSKKIFFGPLGLSFGLKIRGAGPPGHLP